MSRNEIILAVACAVLVVFSLTVAMVIPKRRPDFPAGRMLAFFAVSLVIVGGMLAIVEVFGGEPEEAEAAEIEAEEPAPPAEEPAPPAEEPAPPAEEPAPPAEEPGGDPAAGEGVFLAAGCGGCHTLAAAPSSGTVGPILDEAKPSAERVVEVVTNGSGAMPAFSGQLTEQEIEDVAAYVSQATSG